MFILNICSIVLNINLVFQQRLGVFYVAQNKGLVYGSLTIVERSFLNGLNSQQYVYYNPKQVSGKLLQKKQLLSF